MSPTPENLLILGASTRAAAWSAWRAGFQPVCADAFADTDLRAVADTRPVDDYPEGLVDAVRTVAPCPWMYTGALENHPTIVQRVSESRPLLGNPPSVLRRIRDPFHVRQLLDAASLPALDVLAQDVPPPANGDWLLKPRRSAGGRAISLWLGECPTRERAGATPGEYYFQRRVEGTPVSGLFLGLPGRVELLGIAEQWSGAATPGGSPFGYLGSLVPATIPPAVFAQIRDVGGALGVACGLRGLFGCDFVWDSAAAWLVEVNPRYTASVELFERAFDVSLLGWHSASCAAYESGEARLNRRIEKDMERGFAALGRRPGRVCGKRIVYAEKELGITYAGAIPSTATAGKWPEIADVPAAGTVIGTGQPICTVFAEADDLATCRALLDRRAAAIASSGILGLANVGPQPLRTALNDPRP